MQLKKGIKVQEMEPQYQSVQVDESSEQFSNAVTSPPILNQYLPNSYSSNPVSEIDLIISEDFVFYDRDKLRATMKKYLEPVSVHDGGVSEKIRFLLTCLKPSTYPWKTTPRVLKDYSIYEGYQGYTEDEALRRVTRFYPP